jgi:hypothetical protein
MIRSTLTDAVREWFPALLALLLIGCSGGDGGMTSTPTGPPSAAAEIIVVGKMVAAPTAKSAAGTIATGNAVPLAEGDPIVVTVQGTPSITTSVGADGSFTLRGLPAGSFTLVFTQGGTEIGTLTFREVNPNQQITINIQVVSGEVVLVNEDRRGIGHTGIELEGLVENVVTLNLTGDSTLVIAGRTVIARPGVTAIRKGGTAKTVADLTVGTRVHVKGALVENSTDILAYQIIIQETTPPPGGGGAERTMTICHIPPGRPSNRQTITIGESAWPAHQGHGDTEGPC